MIGKFEMLFVKKPKSVWGYIPTLFAILFKKHDNRKYFEFFKTDKIKIKSKIGIPWTMDGEYGGRKKEVNIYNVSRAIEYVVPI